MKTILKNTLILLVVSFTFVSSVFANTLIVDATDKGYQIYGPTGWYKKNSNSKALHAMVERKSPYVSVGTVVLDNYPTSAITNTTVETFINATKKKFGNFTLRDKKIEKFQGHNAAWYEFSAEVQGYNGFKVIQRHYIILKDNRFYGLIITAPEKTWSQGVSHYQQILSAFKFVVPSASGAVKTNTSTGTKSKYDF